MGAVPGSSNRLALPDRALVRKLAGNLQTRADLGASVDDLLTDFLDGAIKITDADFGNVQLLDKKSATLKLKVQRGLGTEFCQYFARVARNDRSACAAAFKRRKRVLVQNVETSPLYSAETLPIMLAARCRSVQSTPLISSVTGRLIGVVSTASARPQHFQVLNVRLLDELAGVTVQLLESRKVQPPPPIVLPSAVDSPVLADVYATLQSLFATTLHNIRALHQTGTRFLVIDIELALTMLDRAETSKDPETRRRSIHFARRAYEGARRLLARVICDLEGFESIEERLRELARRLRMAESTEDDDA